jgi:hypothetical protein
MTDRTAELEARVAKLNAWNETLFATVLRAFGRVLKMGGRYGALRWFIAGPFSSFASWGIVRMRFLGVRRPLDADAVEIAASYLVMPTLLGMRYRVAEAGDDKVLIEWDECALGYRLPECLNACRAACAIDQATVSRLGGRMVVSENLLEGAPRCVFEITPGP